MKRGEEDVGRGGRIWEEGMRRGPEGKYMCRVKGRHGEKGERTYLVRPPKVSTTRQAS